jgi:formimidoylglutamate deiminase
MNQSSSLSIFAERALLPQGWMANVVIEVAVDGTIRAVREGRPAEATEIAAGPVLPAMPNLHSHAFQRAMAGLAEVSGSGEDSFWTWREEMYRIVGLLGPEDVGAIAARLYVDMQKGGYGAVAEFHYLHHDVTGAMHADPAEMSKRILNAAALSGIGLTLLPVFYAHANFGGTAPSAGQRRFISEVDGFLKLMTTLRAASEEAGATLGLAFHSLRAATSEEMRAILGAFPTTGPIHIHVAEQQREVDDCLAWSGRRPVDFLFDTAPPDGGWCLIHATHMTEAETRRLAGSGAVAGLCPTTEANLGDGIFPGVAFSRAGGRFGIGSDSQVSTSVAEELRLLEYGQRLRDRRRNRLARGPGRSVGRDLYDMALAGGARALGQAIGAIAPGKQASLVVVDGDDALIGAARGDEILDRYIFALGERAVRDVMVQGTWQIRNWRHAREEEIDRAFRRTIEKLARR